jgi:DNA-binding MarR family transcriptional regulator
MRHSNGLGGRPVDLRILRALENLGPQPVTAGELASTLAASAHSVAPALQALVKAGLAQRHWGDLRSVRTYAVTKTGREYLADHEVLTALISRDTSARRP